jgi:hypothetical protein
MFRCREAIADLKTSIDRIEIKVDRLADAITGLDRRLSHLEGQWKIALWIIGVTIASGAVAGWLKLMLH